MYITNQRFWVDHLFDSFSNQDQNNKSDRKISIEEQFNTVSKLVSILFFIFICFYSIRTSAMICISLLFITSLLYYLLKCASMIQENFDEEQQHDSNITKVNPTSQKKKSMVTYHNNDVYIHREEISPSQFKTILPVEVILNYQSKEKKQSPTSYSFSNERRVDHQLPIFRKSIFDPSWEEGSSRPRSTIPTFETQRPQILLGENQKFISRSNVDVLLPSSGYSNLGQKEFQEIFTESEIQRREAKRTSLRSIYKERDKQMKEYPITKWKV